MARRKHTHVPPSAIALAIAHPSRFAAFALALAVSFMTVSALADTPEAQKTSELAKLYKPQGTIAAPQAGADDGIRLTGACVDGYIVFRVRNGAKAWAARGAVQVTDARSGEVLHERRLRLGEGQSASFRVYQNDEQSMFYSFKVKLPGNSLTYVRGFRGRCVLPGTDVVNARR